MSSGIEPVNIIDPWLYATFSGDTALVAQVGQSIYNGAAPGPQNLPALTWNMNSARDITNHQGLTLWAECLFEIKVIGRGSFEGIAPAANRMHALIQGANVTTADGALSCRRDRIIRYDESDDNVLYRHLGGIYRIIAHSTT